MRRITLDEIWASARGCQDIAFDGKAVQFRRLTEALVTPCRSIEARMIRAECTAGVRLRFRSDTRNLHIGLRYGRMSRPYYSGVVLVDGGRIAQFGTGEREAPAWEGTIAPPQRAAGSLVELWLPHQVRTDLSLLAIDDHSDFHPAPPQARRWLAMGDSITQGMTTALPDEAWVSRVALALGLDFRNYGIGGATLDAALATADLGYSFDIATVAYGTNDFNLSVPPAEFSARAVALLARLSKDEPKARIIALSPSHLLGRERNEGGWRLEDYRQALAAAVKEFPACTHLDGADLMPPDPALFVDGVHPNAAGMEVCASNVTRIMRGLIGG